MKLRIFLSLIVSVVVASSAWGVTREEMEQARTITAQAFLRYMNNGSDYLDKLDPVKVSDLKNSLKTKEKENIKIFESIEYPKIEVYSQWSKDDLLKYWGTDFWNDSRIPAHCKGARVRVKSKIGAMNVGAEAIKSQETTATLAEADNAASEAQRVLDSIKMAASIAAEEAILEASNDVVQEDFASDSIAAEESAIEEEENVKSKSSPTLIYSLILIVLVVIIAALIVYAVKGIQKSGKQDVKRDKNDETDSADEEDDDNHIYKETLDEKDREIASLKAEIDRLNNVILRMNDRISDAISEISPNQRPTRTIYLAYANSKNVFVRADSVYNEDYSIFKLVTSDGITGSFSVIDNPIANKLALSLPISILKNSCQSEDMHHDNWCKQIITENAGTAIFENGRWIVKRKADINFQ